MPTQESNAVMETMAMTTAKSLNAVRMAKEKYGVFFNAFRVTQARNVTSDRRTDIRKTFGYHCGCGQIS